MVYLPSILGRGLLMFIRIIVIVVILCSSHLQMLQPGKFHHLVETRHRLAYLGSVFFCDVSMQWVHLRAKSMQVADVWLATVNSLKRSLLALLLRWGSVQ